jgi:hypothetical protein
VPPGTVAIPSAVLLAMGIVIGIADLYPVSLSMLALPEWSFRSKPVVPEKRRRATTGVVPESRSG